MEINALILQAPVSFRNDDQKIWYIRCSVLDAPWAQSATSQLSTIQYFSTNFVLFPRQPTVLYQAT